MKPEIWNFGFITQGFYEFFPVLKIKGDRQIMFDKPYLVKYAGKQVSIFYLAKKRRKMTCPG
jgi:hypothetical protein